MRYGWACASGDLFCLFVFFLSPDFHELWRNMMSTCLITEVVMGYISTGMGGSLSTLLVSLMSLHLVLVNTKPLLGLFISPNW